MADPSAAAVQVVAVDEQQRKAAEQLKELSQLVLQELGSKWLKPRGVFFDSFAFSK